MEPVERGEAKMRVSLSKGVIKVHHGYDGTLLLKGVARKGAWDRILKTIVRNCTNPTGPMSEA